MVRLESCFFVVGVPGILLALVFQLTVKEPPRGHSENIGTPVTPPSSSVVKFMWGSKPLRHIVIAGSLIAFTGYATIIWIPIYLVRIHEMGTGEAVVTLPYSLASAVPLVFIWAAGPLTRCRSIWATVAPLASRHRESYGPTTLIPCIHGTNANAGDCVLRPSGHPQYRLRGARVRTYSKRHAHRNAISRRCD